MLNISYPLVWIPDKVGAQEGVFVFMFTPLKTDILLKIDGWKMKLPFKTRSLFRAHVST